MSHVDFLYFDCDNHFYEALDAFTRHIEPQYRKRAMQWVEVDGKTRLMVGEKINRFIPNPTFDPISKPGAHGRVLPWPQPQAAEHPRAVRRARPDGRPPGVPRPRRAPAR